MRIIRRILNRIAPRTFNPPLPPCFYGEPCGCDE